MSSYKGTYFVGNELLPKDFDIKEILIEEKERKQKNEFEIIDGKGVILKQLREPYHSLGIINMHTNGKIKIRRLYFPGWTVIRNSSNILFKNMSIMQIPLTKGENIISITYQDPFFVKVATAISIITLIINLWVLTRVLLKFRYYTNIV